MNCVYGNRSTTSLLGVHLGGLKETTQPRNEVTWLRPSETPSGLPWKLTGGEAITHQAGLRKDMIERGDEVFWATLCQHNVLDNSSLQLLKKKKEFRHLTADLNVKLLPWIGPRHKCSLPWRSGRGQYQHFSQKITYTIHYLTLIFLCLIERIHKNS